jgi:hypothetical protein
MPDIAPRTWPSKTPRTFQSLHSSRVTLRAQADLQAPLKVDVWHTQAHDYSIDTEPEVMLIYGSNTAPIALHVLDKLPLGSRVCRDVLVVVEAGLQ